MSTKESIRDKYQYEFQSLTFKEQLYAIQLLLFVLCREF